MADWAARRQPVVGATCSWWPPDDRPDPGRCAVGGAVDAEAGDVQVVGLGDPLKITGCPPDHSCRARPHFRAVRESEQTKTRALAEQVNGLGRMDAIIHNAGVYADLQRFPTPEGHPRTLAVSALAPYLLTALVERPDRLIYLTSDMGRCRESTPGQPRVARVTGSLLVRGRTPIDRVFLSD